MKKLGEYFSRSLVSSNLASTLADNSQRSYAIDIRRTQQVHQEFRSQKTTKQLDTASETKRTTLSVP